MMAPWQKLALERSAWMDLWYLQMIFTVARFLKWPKEIFFKYNVTDFDEEEEIFTLAYSAQTIK